MLTSVDVKFTSIVHLFQRFNVTVQYDSSTAGYGEL